MAMPIAIYSHHVNQTTIFWRVAKNPQFFLKGLKKIYFPLDKALSIYISISIYIVNSTALSLGIQAVSQKARGKEKKNAKDLDLVNNRRSVGG